MISINRLYQLVSIVSLQYFYWILPLALFSLQVVFTLSSTSQIRAEEMANGIRNPFWLSGRTVYDGISSNFGWDGTLLLIYEFFGFDIFAGKYYRLLVHLVSLFCIAALFRRFLGEKLAVVPLLTIGLSPTFIFFSSLQSQYGIDLEYLPIVLLLITHERGRLARLAGWFLAMVAWLSYPTFVYYLPALAVTWIKGIRGKRRIREIGLGIGAFLAPLILGFLWIENKQTLIHDPQTGTGIFRGGGGEFLKGNVDFALGNLFTDLFSKGVSYNFDLTSAEFSLLFPVISVIVVFWLGAVIFRKRKKLLILILITFVFNFAGFVLFSDNTGSPGLRRATAMLAAFYGLFVVGWWYINKLKVKSEKLKVVGRVLLLALLLHHVIVYPQNLEGIKRESKFRETYWSTTSREGVYKIFNDSLSVLQKEELYLSCSKDPGVTCRYSDFYAALAGACRWNNLPCHTIYGEDPATGRFIPLRRELWNSGYLAH